MRREARHSVGRHALEEPLEGCGVRRKSRRKAVLTALLTALTWKNGKVAGLPMPPPRDSPKTRLKPTAYQSSEPTHMPLMHCAVAERAGGRVGEWVGGWVDVWVGGWVDAWVGGFAY